MKIQTLKTRFRRLRYQIRHEYLTLNNVVIAIALLIAASWAWGSVSVMQRNFTLQRNLEDKQRQLTLTQLEVDTLKYQTNYYASTEYQELTARDHLGLALPGESLLILPENSAAAKASDTASATNTLAAEPQTNLEQWINFLSGKNAKQLR